MSQVLGHILNVERRNPWMKRRSDGCQEPKRSVGEEVSSMVQKRGQPEREGIFPVWQADPTGLMKIPLKDT